MRFAVKTRPEHQSWEELRDIWVAADEITCSCLIRLDGEDYDGLLTSLAGWRDAGVDLAVIGLPLHAKPDSLSALAEALAPLA